MYKKGYFPQPRTQAASKGMDLCWHNTVIFTLVNNNLPFLEPHLGIFKGRLKRLFTGLEVRTVKNCEQSLRNAPWGHTSGATTKSTLSVQYLLPWPVREWIKRLYSIEFLSCETKAIKRCFNVMLNAKSCQHIKANLSIFNSYLIRSHS